nr:immunoglobulin light chain junction region [Macaca mulatta]
HQQHNTFPYSF